MELDQDLSDQACASCGIVFGLPTYFETQRRNDGLGFMCPNGHSLSFGGGKTTVPLLQAEVDKLTKENAELKKVNIALQSKIDQLEAKAANQK